ncbi:hypothetical protein AQJ91_47135 [Streptomyces dysideae]|uniref:Transposase n=1 Tax=Streptomyces dysideae TaxID=909626 RepID=A0A117RX34_9ACTN|nr:hypothetical protein AQJ91_47135 [Streptomyces dysideae]
MLSAWPCSVTASAADTMPNHGTPPLVRDTAKATRRASQDIPRIAPCIRYPAEIIAHCVWLYHRFPLSFREVEELILERGVVVSHETIRQWCSKFGQSHADALRRRRPRPGDKWHLDELHQDQSRPSLF